MALGTFNSKIQNASPAKTDDNPKQESMYDGAARAVPAVEWDKYRAGDPDMGKINGDCTNSADVKAPKAAG